MTATMQQLPIGDAPQSMPGIRMWEGFADFDFLIGAAVALLLASVLGAVIAFHPTSRRNIHSLEDAEAQKVYVLYAAIGAIAGSMVLKYGTVVGFVVFGIGGLIRFRTDLRSAPMTGRLILITLIGLACGLGLPHLAMLATLFGFVLIALLDANVTCRIVVKHIAGDSLVDAAQAYRTVLEHVGCRVLAETKSFAKEQVTLVFHAPHRLPREVLVQELETGVPQPLRGAVYWDAD
jgi:hypothetical protein